MAKAKDGRTRVRDSVAVAAAVIPPRWLLVLLAIVFGVLAEVLYGFAQRPWLATFSSALLFSLASLLGGGLFGFLFGLPHADRAPSSSTSAPSSGPHITNAASASGTPSRFHASPPATPRVDVAPSTNLQQIADWLTKLILGAGLTQIYRLPHAASVLFHSMASAFGGSVSAAQFSGGIVIYFTILGFITGWLATYFFLTPAMARLERRTDALVEQSSLLAARAARATAAGQAERAQKLRAASRVQAQTARTLAETYAAVYRHPRADPMRTAELDQAIEAAARQALSMNPTPPEVKAQYGAGPQRQTEIALAMMAIDPTKLDLDSVLQSISASRTAIEQYQALRALRASVDRLAAGDVERVRTTVDGEMNSGMHFSRLSARYRLAQEILQAFGPSGAGA